MFKAKVVGTEKKETFQQSESVYSIAHANSMTIGENWRIGLLSIREKVFLCYSKVVLYRDGSGSPVPLTKEAIKSAQLTYEGSFKDPEVLKHWSGSGNLRQVFSASHTLTPGSTSCCTLRCAASHCSGQTLQVVLLLYWAVRGTSHPVCLQSSFAESLHLLGRHAAQYQSATMSCMLLEWCLAGAPGQPGIILGFSLNRRQKV